MKIARLNFGLFVLSSTTAMLAGCSYEISGTVKDLETGEPLAGTSVGMFESLLPIPHSQNYVEKDQADSEGAFQFESEGVSRTFEAHAPDYQSLVLYLDSSTDQNLDVEMRSIASIKGTWDATVTLSDTEMRTFQFVFSEEGMAWHEDGEELGIVPLLSRAPEIAVDDYMAFSRFYIIGNVKMEMALDESGDSMTGTITDFKLFEFECSPCNATVEAIRTVTQ